MAKVLLLPGSKWQLSLAKRIKELGHWLCVVSPEEKPPCAALADDFFRSDIFAVDAITNHAKELGIEAVLSDECDIAMPVVAELGKRLNLPTMSCEAAALYTDKFLMREFCIQHGLKSPEYKLCKTADDAVAFLRKLGRPIIIKPLDSNASHGVFKTETEEEVRDHFAEALSFSRIEHAVLAERFIEGTEFTVDGIKTPSAHYTLAISEKKHFKHNLNIANELFFTHSNPRFDYEKLRATNDAFVMASPLLYGFTHAEYKCEDGEYYLIEIGARGGGNMISSVITQFMSGYQTYDYLISAALDEIQATDFSDRSDCKSRCAVLKFFDAPLGGGVVKEIIGEDKLKENEAIKEFQLNFGVGDEIGDCLNDSARIGFYIACTESEKELRSIMKFVMNHFRIIISKNNNQYYLTN